MRRRALLAGLAGLAGCSGLDSGGTPERTLTPAPVPTPTSTPTPDPFDRDRSLGSATVGRSEVAGRTVALYPPRFGSGTTDVLIQFEAPATTGHPARLRAFLRGEPGAMVPAAFSPFAPRPRFDPENDPGERRPTALFAVPTPGTEFARHVPEVELAHGGGSAGSVWRLAGPPTDWLPERVQVPADGTLTATFHLVADSDATAPPTGRYRPPSDDQFRTRLVAWETDAPGPENGSRLARDRRLPPPPSEERVVWFHEATPETPVYLRPSAERVTAPETVSFTLVNHATDGAGASDWTCYRLDGGDWYEVGPLFRDAIARFLPPGGRHRWRFEFAHGQRDDTAEGDLDFRFGFLSGGTYAVVAGRTPAGERPAALVELDAPSVTLRPTADARAGRDGDQVTVRSEQPRDDGDEEPQALVLDRLPLGDRTATPRPTVTDPGAALARLLPEQAMRSRGLRNTLAFVDDGVREVRLLTTDDVVRGALRRVSLRTGGRRFRFADGRFRLTVDSVRTPAGTDKGTTTPDGTDGGGPVSEEQTGDSG